MNYAEDRLDRKARGTGLWDDFSQALERSDDVLLGRTLRDCGWIRHAAFHYSRAWQAEADRVGDYAQMVELAGFPELGVLALLHYRMRGSLMEVDDERFSLCIINDALWLQKEAPEAHCGCGLKQCGQSLCSVPMTGLEPVLEAIQTYVNELSSRTMPTAYGVLSALSKNQTLTFSDDIPELLKFWKSESSTADDYSALSPVLQLLLLKQLYLVLPTLAAEAVVHLRVNQRQMAIDYKSHNAYHVLIQSVVLGERIKPHRIRTMPAYHVPVWDVLWGLDGRHGQLCRDWHHPQAAAGVMTHFTHCINMCKDLSSTMGTIPRLLIMPSTNKPLFVVGDSHVLSIAWQTIRLPNGEYRTLVPVVVTGLKAWHCRIETRFFTHSLLNLLLKRLPPTDYVLLSAGEIDCREGLGGPQLEGYTVVNKEHAHRTVHEFVTSLSALQPLKVLVMPVCPHAHRSNKNGKALGRAVRRQITELWNENLRTQLPFENVDILNYEGDLYNTGYVLQPAFNADGTHMNSAFLPCLEKSLDVVLSMKAADAVDSTP